MYTVETTSAFDRRADRFFRQHPELRSRFADFVLELRRDPHQPHLRLHRLSGKFDGLHAASFTYSIRVILTVLVTEQSITLIDIGTHDEVYRR
jgi:mRNA-degrading endonuclease YafQ of YafQ-DinJ toxin-antitoxin module